MKQPKTVLVVGAGLTGSMLSHYLAHAPGGNQIRLTFWEKSHGPGGRFSTVRSREPNSPLIDTGAQYITRGAGRAPDADLYSELLSQGVIQRYKGVVDGARSNHEEQEHYVCSDGMASVAAHLLKASGAAVEYERRALELSTDAGRWHVADTEGKRADFDAVVVTVPTPQLLELEGASLAALLEPHRDGLARAARRYSMRFAACLYYEPAAWSCLRAVPWASKYFKAGECGTESLVYASIEPRKRSLEEAEAPPALLLHTSVPYGFANEHADADAVLATMLSDLQKAIPGLPPPARTKLHKWKYSQAPPADKEMNGETGVVAGAEDGAMLLGGAAAGAPPLVLAGDGLVGSNFDSCAFSARAACAKLLEGLS